MTCPTGQLDNETFQVIYDHHYYIYYHWSRNHPDPPLHTIKAQLNLFWPKICMDPTFLWTYNLLGPDLFLIIIFYWTQDFCGSTQIVGAKTKIL